MKFGQKVSYVCVKMKQDRQNLSKEREQGLSDDMLEWETTEAGAKRVA